MSHSEFHCYSQDSYNRFITDAAAASGEPIDSVKSRIGAAPKEPHVDDLWFIVEYQKNIAGYFWLRVCKEKQEAFGFDIYLNPECRGIGIGRGVMLAGREILKKQRVSKIRICVFCGNQIAKSLYESLGFKEIAVHKEKGQITMEICI